MLPSNIPIGSNFNNRSFSKIHSLSLTATLASGEYISKSASPLSATDTISWNFNNQGCPNAPGITVLGMDSDNYVSFVFGSSYDSETLSSGIFCVDFGEWTPTSVSIQLKTYYIVFWNTGTISATITYDVSVTEGFGVTVTQPTAASVWKSGNSQEIKWNGNTGLGYTISLYYDGVFETQIKSVSSFSQKYCWEIPSSLNQGFLYQIEITSGSESDFSDNFEITNTGSSNSCLKSTSTPAPPAQTQSTTTTTSSTSTSASTSTSTPSSETSSTSSSPNNDKTSSSEGFTAEIAEFGNIEIIGIGLVFIALVHIKLGRNDRKK